MAVAVVVLAVLTRAPGRLLVVPVVEAVCPYLPGLRRERQALLGKGTQAVTEVSSIVLAVAVVVLAQ